MLQGVVLEEQLGAERADLLLGVVEPGQARQPARPVRQHVGVEQQQQLPARERGAAVVGHGVAAVLGEHDGAEGNAVELEQLAGESLERRREVGRVEDVDQVGFAQLGIVNELRQLLLEEVDPAVERDDDRDVGDRAGLAVLEDRVDVGLRSSSCSWMRLTAGTTWSIRGVSQRAPFGGRRGCRRAPSSRSVHDRRGGPRAHAERVLDLEDPALGGKARGGDARSSR